MIVAQSITLSEPRLDGEHYWLEGRPQERLSFLLALLTLAACCSFRNSSGSFAKFAAICGVSSRAIWNAHLQLGVNFTEAVL
jgi:hypothetical protein